jgi:apolipoprotein N-acyltransferase
MSRRRRPPQGDTPAAAAAAAAPEQTRRPFLETYRGRLVLAVLTVTLLTLGFAPIGQFYLTWVGLVPWLILVARTPRAKPLFWWSWLTGILFYGVNMWWLAFVTLPGAAALVVYLGLWFGLVALVIRATGLFQPAASPRPVRATLGAVLIISILWVAQDWLRGNLFTGLPWLYLGHTQTPILAMCQIADVAGAYGVTFWLVLVNVWLALLFLDRPRWTHLVPAGAAVGLILVATLAYGLYRMGQETGSPGPTVMVVQPNFPQDNSGAKGAPIVELVRYHLDVTREALSTLDAQGKTPDLVVWSETMMPEINREYRQFLRNHPDLKRQDIGFFFDRVHDQLVQLTERFHTNLLTGGIAMMPDRRRPAPTPDKQTWNRFNSAYLVDPSGRGAGWRYDKIHAVPFGEYIPFRDSFPPLYRFFNLFNPYESDYTVAPGKELTVLAIMPHADVPPASGPTTRPIVRAAPYRFVAPICFEDIDSRLVASMFRSETGQHEKRAQFIVNLTNDGWFRANEMAQHLQVAVFRSIENRAPTARSVNTGISGFIDPVGRTHDLIPAGTEGVATARLTLDSRVTLYTRHGDLFAAACVIIATALTGLMLYRWMKYRRGVGR